MVPDSGIFPDSVSSSILDPTNVKVYNPNINNTRSLCEYQVPIQMAKQKHFENTYLCTVEQGITNFWSISHDNVHNSLNEDNVLCITKKSKY